MHIVPTEKFTEECKWSEIVTETRSRNYHKSYSLERIYLKHLASTKIVRAQRELPVEWNGPSVMKQLACPKLLPTLAGMARTMTVRSRTTLPEPFFVTHLSW